VLEAATRQITDGAVERRGGVESKLLRGYVEHDAESRPVVRAGRTGAALPLADVVGGDARLRLAELC